VTTSKPSSSTIAIAVMTLLFSLVGRLSPTVIRATASSSTSTSFSLGIISVSAFAFSPISNRNHLATTTTCTIGLNAFQIYHVGGKKHYGSNSLSRPFIRTGQHQKDLAGSNFSGTVLHSSSTTTFTALPETHPYLSEIKPALSAIRKACRITTHLQPTTAQSNISGLNKKDASPVTIGDFAVQALVLNLLEKQFKKEKDDDGCIYKNVFIAEEGSKNLDNDDDNLSTEILQVMKSCGYDDIISNVEELKRSIDLGQTYQPNGELYEHILKEESKNDDNTSSPGRPLRTWCLDPIDGTRGFLRGKREGGQYCIALALIEDGVPVLGILGCPNLPVSPMDTNYAWSDDETSENNVDTRGCIIVASKNGGCYQLPLYPLKDDEDDSSTLGSTRIHVTQNDGEGKVPLSQARFCIGVEKYSDPDGKISSIAESIHGTLDSDGDIMYSARMDSQVKYGVLARGGAEIFARLPKKSYVEWIWDHAPGRVVIEEAGGAQIDTKGNLINYGLGAKMDETVDGILASPGGVFQNALIEAVKENA